MNLVPTKQSGRPATGQFSGHYKIVSPCTCDECAPRYNTRTLDLDQQLELEEFDSGTVWLARDIDDGDVPRLARRLDHHARLGAETLILRITSPGGAVYPALALHDLLRGCGMSVTGIVEGFAASAASMIVLQGCHQRWARPNARILIHEPRRFSFGMERTSDLKDEHKEMEILSSVVADIMAKRSGHTTAEVEALFERHEHWMSATEAAEFGLIDRVLA